MRAQNTREWSWPDLLNELKSYGILIKPEAYPWDGPPDECSGGSVINLFSIRNARRIAETFDISYSDAEKMLTILKQLDKRCK